MIRKTVDDIDNVFRYLLYYKSQALRRLFPDMTEISPTWAQWNNRDSYEIWCYLSTVDRQRLVIFAREQYQPS